MDVPADPRAIFTADRVVPFVITFVVICGMWLEHYRIFRYHFVARSLEVIVNFIFLFGLALLPYAVQTFIVAKRSPIALSFYFGDFALVMSALSVLRLRGLIAGAQDLSEEEKLRDWKRVIIQLGISLAMGAAVFALLNGWLLIDQAVTIFAPAMAGVILAIRLVVRKLPGFLQPSLN